MRHAMPGMLCTLSAAGLTNVRTKRTNGFGVFATTRHGRRRQRADLRAIHVQRNAPRHHLDVWLLQAGSRAMVAGHNASVASFNTRLECLMAHFTLPS